MKLTLLAALCIVALQSGVEAQSFQGLGNFSDDLSTHSGAEDISPDGRVVVGQSNGRAFRWTTESGLQPLGFSQDGAALVSAYAVSADGSVVAGGNEFPAPERNAFRWTAETGAISLAA